MLRFDLIKGYKMGSCQNCGEYIEDDSILCKDCFTISESIGKETLQLDNEFIELKNRLNTFLDLVSVSMIPLGTALSKVLPCVKHGNKDCESDECIGVLEMPRNEMQLVKNCLDHINDLRKELKLLEDSN